MQSKKSLILELANQIKQAITWSNLTRMIGSFKFLNDPRFSLVFVVSDETRFPSDGIRRSVGWPFRTRSLTFISWWLWLILCYPFRPDPQRIWRCYQKWMWLMLMMSVVNIVLYLYFWLIGLFLGSTMCIIEAIAAVILVYPDEFRAIQRRVYLENRSAHSTSRNWRSVN